MLGLAKRVGARFLLTSTSEVYGDPLQHPQKETYWGNVNPIGRYRFLSRSFCCYLFPNARNFIALDQKTSETAGLSDSYVSRQKRFSFTVSP